ncbi:MAG: hypothetical protein Q9159_005011 [Coniocarpon cinnabarinum]
MSLMTFTVYISTPPSHNFALLVPSPAIPSISHDFHISHVFDSVFIITIWDLGEALVPLVIAPLSEHYGRRPVYHISIGMLIGTVFCRLTLDRVMRAKPHNPSASSHRDKPSTPVHTNDDTAKHPQKPQQEREFSAGPVPNKHENIPRPIKRLLPMLPGAIILPAGLFIYGWTLEAHTPWIIPILGTSLMGFGLSATTIPTYSYIVDVFEKRSASAMAAALMLRNLVGAFLPLVGPSLFEGLGYGRGNSVLGFVAAGFIPVPLLLIWKEPA